MEILFELHPNEPRVRQLSDADPRFGELAHKVGSITVPAQGDAFAYMARSLIGQQLSVKAAGTICQRVEQACGGFTLDAMLSASEETLRNTGVSRPKISYIKGLAQAICRNELDLELFPGLSDEEVITSLSKVKGIGRWTAEMFLIFYLGREDVLSLGDAGLRRSAYWLYEEEGKPADSSFLERQGERWKPYRTVASLYLWEAINRGFVDAGPYRTYNGD